MIPCLWAARKERSSRPLWPLGGSRRAAIGRGWGASSVADPPPLGAWEDISLRSDRGPALHTASLSYRMRLTEQEARPIEWG